MRYLKQKYWDYFFYQNDGINFEKLCRILLKDMYPNFEWQSTKKTWDGKKDFVGDFCFDHHHNIKYWAECKCRKNKLSIDDISSTMIIGSIEDINILILFSYSKLIESNRQYLSDFSAKNKIQLDIIDDEVLEAQILKSYKNKNLSKIIQSFFPKFNFENYTNFKEIKSEKKIKVTYKYFLPYNNVNKNGIPIYRVNDIISINFYIQNMLPNKEIDVKIDFGNIDRKYIFPIIQNKKTILKLKPGEIKSISCKYKLINFKKELVLPFLKYNDEYCIPKAIKCKWLIDVPLIGSQYLKCIDRYNDLISQSENTNSICTLFGKSAVGKSRLFKEILDNSLYHFPTIISFNGEYGKSNANIWVKSFLSQSYLLPIIDIDSAIDLQPSNIKEVLYNIMYNKKFNLDTHIEECVNLIIFTASEQDFLLAFDNVQFFDEISLSIIDNLLNYAISNPLTNIHLLFTFNTDYVFPKTKAENIYNRLKNISKEYPRNTLMHEVKGFNKSQAQLFIRQCVSCKQENPNYYKNTIEKLINKIGTLPLMLEQTLLYLDQIGSISKIDDYFIIKDIKKFNKNISTIPDTINEIFKERFNILEKSFSQNDYKMFQYILKIAMFMGEINFEIINCINLDLIIFENCISLGIFKMNLDGNYIFIHNLLHLFLEKKYKNYIYDIQDDIIFLIERKNWSNLYFAQYFILKQLNTLDKSLLPKACDKILINRIPNHLKQLYDQQFINLLTILKENDISKILFKTINKICYNGQIYLPYDKSYNRYKFIYENILLTHKNFKSYGTMYAKFIKQYANIAILAENEKDFLDNYNKFINLWNSLNFSNEIEAQRSFAFILNRESVIYRRLNDYDNAEKSLNESQIISEKIKDYGLMIRNCFDYGHLYLHHDLSLAIRWWESALDIFEKNYSKEIEDRRGAVYFHKSLANICKKNYINAMKYAVLAERFFNITETVPYYVIRIHLLKAIIILLDKQNIFEVTDCENEILIAEDLSVITQSDKLYFKAILTKSMYYYIHNSIIEMQIFLKLGLKVLYNCIDFSLNKEKKYEKYIISYMMIAKKSNILNEIQFENYIISSKLKSKLKNLKEMSKNDFNIIYEDYSIDLILYNEEYKCPFFLP